MEKNYILFGIILSVIGYFLGSVIDVMYKGVLDHIPVYVVSMMVGLFCIIFMVGSQIAVGRSDRIKAKSIKFCMWRAATGVCGYYLCLVSLRYLPLVDYYLIAFLFPFATLLLSSVMLKEKPTLPQLIATVVAFAAIAAAALAAHTDTASATTSRLSVWWVYGVATLAVFVNAYSTLLIRQRGQQEHTVAISLWGSILSFISGFVITAYMHYVGEVTYAISVTDVVKLIGISVIGIGTTLTIFRAYQIAPANFLAPLLYTLVVWGALWGYVFFDTIPTVATLTASAVIIAAGLYITLTRNKAASR